MEAAPAPALEESERRVWDFLTAQDAVTIDVLLARLPLAPSEVYGALLGLEMRSLVRELPGKKYIRRL
jgi:hypothetical protein